MKYQYQQLIGGACSWPLTTLFALTFRDSLGWRGCWILIGICALIVFVFRFSLPESPRWLATHGQGDRFRFLLDDFIDGGKIAKGQKPSYSSRRATKGSTPAARRAGM